jgi:hypothetical protein
MKHVEEQVASSPWLFDTEDPDTTEDDSSTSDVLAAAPHVPRPLSSQAIQLSVQMRTALQRMRASDGYQKFKVGRTFHNTNPFSFLIKPRARLLFVVLIDKFSLHCTSKTRAPTDWSDQKRGMPGL